MEFVIHVNHTWIPRDKDKVPGKRVTRKDFFSKIS